MAILDAPERTPDEIRALLQTMQGVFKPILDSEDLDPGLKQVFSLLDEGLALADIFGVTRADRAVLCKHAAGLLKAGRLEAARGLAFRLTILEPIDALPFYLLAMSYQLDNQFEAAGKLYLEFVARDATNPEGYIRLGECLLAEGSLAQARDSFITAGRLCAAGHGPQTARNRAAALLAATEARLSASSETR